MAHEFVARFSFPYTRETAAKGILDLLCADERHAVGKGLYLRTVAGAYGVGQDTNTALRLQGAKELPPPHVQASLVAKAALGLYKLRMGMHISCAGEVAADSIQMGIATNIGPDGQNVYEAIKNHYADPFGNRTELPKQRFDKIRQAAEDQQAAGFADVRTVQDLFDNGGIGPKGEELPPLERHPLVDMGHIGTHFVLDYRQGVALDTHAGLKEHLTTGDPLWTPPYSANVGAAELIEVVCGLYPAADPADFHDAMFVRNAVSSLYLPKQGPEGAQAPPQLYVAAR